MALNQERAAYLDGLRGLAALAVVLFHMNVFMTVVLPYGGIAGIPQMLLARLTNGNFAVCIFFVLSGYVLVAPFVREGSRLEIGEAAIRRYFRLTPVALASVLFSYLLWATVGFQTSSMAEWGIGFGWMGSFFQQPFSFMGALWNGLAGIYAGDSSYNGPLWTIELELWGSLLLFAFTALFIKSRSAPLIAAVACILLISFLGERGIYFSLFLAGAVLHIEPRLIGRWYLVIPALYLGSLTQWTPDGTFLMTSIGAPWGTFSDTVAPHAVAAVLLLSGILGSRKLQKMLSKPPIMWLGRISFSLYAVHVPVIFALGNGVFLLLAQAGYYWLGGLCAVMTVLLVSCALGHFLYRLVDLPSQMMAKRVAARIYRSEKKVPLSLRDPQPAASLAPLASWS